MSNSSAQRPTKPTRYSRTAILAFVASALGGLSAFFLGDVVVLPVAFSLAGVALGLISRKELQRDDALGGAGASAAGAIIGAIVLIIVLLPWVLVAFANVSAGTA